MVSEKVTSDGFHGEYRFLSNFWESPIRYGFFGEEFIFSTGEHLYQAFKTLAVVEGENPARWVQALADSATPGVAKRLGATVPVNVDKWERIRVEQMSVVVWEKFTQNKQLGELLKNSGNVELVEFNKWGDVFWGVDIKTGVGENQLGKILMHVRELLTSS